MEFVEGPMALCFYNNLHYVDLTVVVVVVVLQSQKRNIFERASSKVSFQH